MKKIFFEEIWVTYSNLVTITSTGDFKYILLTIETNLNL